MNSIQSISYTALTNGNASLTYERLIHVYKNLQEVVVTFSGDAGGKQRADGLLLQALSSLVLPKLEEFSVRTEEFIALIRQMVGSSHTRDMEALDADRDRLIGIADRTIAAGLRSTHPDVVISANHVDVIRRLYGNIAARQRNEQTQITTKLIRDLSTPEMEEHVERIPGLKAMLESIEELNNSFTTSLEERDAERAGVIIGGTLEARRIADALALEVANLINSTASLYQDPTLTEVINEANVVLNQARHDLTARRRGRALSQSHQNQNEQQPDEIIDEPLPDDGGTEEEFPDKEE
jgi:hypothetical protein